MKWFAACQMAGVVWHWDPATCKALPSWKKSAQHWILLYAGAPGFVTLTQGWKPGSDRGLLKSLNYLV